MLLSPANGSRVTWPPAVPTEAARLVAAHLRRQRGVEAFAQQDQRLAAFAQRAELGAHAAHARVSVTCRRIISIASGVSLKT